MHNLPGPHGELEHSAQGRELAVHRGRLHPSGETRRLVRLDALGRYVDRAIESENIPKHADVPFCMGEGSASVHRVVGENMSASALNVSLSDFGAMKCGV